MVENILSQEEVDALLSAVDRGELPEALAADDEPASKLIVRYNFRKPNRVSKDQIKMLQSIHETFARLYTSSLTTLLRGLAEVEFRGVEQVSYGEFVMALSPPTCLAMFNMEPLKGGALRDINAHVLFLIIDRLLGGSGLIAVRMREFTEVEKVLMERVAIRAMVDLRQARHHVGAYGFRVDHTETNPQFVQLTSPSEVVVAVTFDVTIGDVSGPMTIVYPHVLLEPIMPKLNSHRWFAAAPRGASAEEEAGLRQSVLRLGITVRGVLAEIPLSIRDLLAMKPGDILCSGRPVDVPALVELEGVPRFTARPGIANRHKALQLLSVIPKGETPRDPTSGSGNARILSA
jgi:flagellar motor switch protein FliM